MKLTSVVLILSLLSVYDCVPLSWEEMEVDGLIRNRWLAGTAFKNPYLYIFGGETSKRNSNDTGILDDVWYVDLTTPNSEGQHVWEQLPTSTLGPSPRYGFVSGMIGNYWIISHGCNTDRCFRDTWVRDLSLSSTEQRWMLVSVASNSSSDPIPEARYSRAGGVYPGQDQFWLSMGQTDYGKKLSDTWILQLNFTDLDDIRGSWRQVSPGGGFNQYHPYIPSARFLHAGAPINTSTFAIFGGCASGGQAGGLCPIQDNWVIESDSDEWESHPSCVPPRVRGSMIGVPNSPGKAFIIGGSQNYTPGIFPQQIIPMASNDTEIYIMNTIGRPVATNDSMWKRVFVDRTNPGSREGASVVVDETSGVVYLVGGRQIESSAFQSDIWKLTGDGDLDIDQNCPLLQFTYVHLHGLIMYVAWGLLLPLGTLLGRYYRWTWPCWFVFHVIFQSLGVLFTVAGFTVIFLVGSYSYPNFPHAIIGIVLTFILLQQFLTGIFHPCVDKENGKTSSHDKTGYRKCWEVYHGASGFISIAIGFGQILLGILLIGAPMIVWTVWAGLGLLWVLIFIIHECIYLCCKLVQREREKKLY